MNAIVTILQVGMVFAILFVAMWALKRYGNKTGTRGAITVAGRATIGGRAAVAIVTVGDKSYLLGVTEQQVNLIAEVDPAEVVAEQGTPSLSFAQQLARAQNPQPATVGEAIVAVFMRMRARRAAHTSPQPTEPAPGPLVEESSDA